MTKGKVKEAEVIYKAFKQNNPEEPNVYWNLAVIYSQTNRNDLARQELREMLQVDPGNKRAKDFLKELEPTP